MKVTPRPTLTAQLPPQTVAPRPTPTSVQTGGTTRTATRPDWPPRHVHFADLPTRRSQGSQAAPTTRDVGVQVSDRNFRQPLPATTPAVPSARPVPATAEPQRAAEPVYVGLDHDATRLARFQQEIREARAACAGRVRFTAVKDGARDIGYILSARYPLPAGERPAPPPALYVAGRSTTGTLKTRFTARADIFTIAGDPANPTALARDLRREATRLQEGTFYPGRADVPNYRVGSDTLGPAEAARYVSNAGRAPQHTQRVDVFVAAPGQSVHLSTVLRTMPQGVYAGVLYGMH
ncbi:hypothetical protein GN316_11345 [Xylophilus sp. Kf1]|nr:hypothetical protein [Xylophilus sp. Kf1]